MSRSGRLPPMQTLAAFESAARLASFTAAARELNSTQPAISQRVIQLEEYLGTPLFERSHRGVTLTDDGVLMFEAVRQSLASIRMATDDIRARRSGDSLNILTDFGFATYWLLPRLAQLREAMPGVQVKLITSQDFEPPRDRADVAISFGDGDWAGQVTRLFPEEVFPVCSPVYRQASGSIGTPSDLYACTLLHLQPAEPQRWMSWHDWFAAHELDAPLGDEAVTFNSYAHVIHATLMGQGVALGWSPLVDTLLSTGQLVRVFAESLHTGRGYFLVCAASRSQNAAAAAFCDWIVRECATPG
jgi:putative choline sulfate-utilization transcription factor